MPASRPLISRALALILTFVVIVASLAGCGGDVSRIEALEAMASDGAVPAYESAALAAHEFEQSVAELCREPSSTVVEDTRQELIQFRLELAMTEAFRQGPAMDQRDQGRIYTPIEPAAIEEAIESLDPSSFDAHYVSTSVGATRRGLYAIEYVLFAEESSDSTSSALEKANRCTYLSALSGAVAENVQLTSDGWTQGGDIKPSQIELLANIARQQDNMNVSVETSIFLLRKIINMELAPALGLVGTEPHIEELAEGSAEQGLPILRERLGSVEQAMVGPTGVSELLAADLSGRIRAELAAAQLTIDELTAAGGPSLRRAVLDDSSGVEKLHDQIMTVERTLSTEVVGELGVVVGFSDADGDSAN